MRTDILVITQDRNTPGRNDFKGAFLPEAKAFMKHHDVDPANHLQVDISRPLAARRGQVLNLLRDHVLGFTTVVFLCHGLTNKLPHLGWTTQNVHELASAIHARALIPARVMLYACSSAGGAGPGGDGGFADALRDALCVAGDIDCQVDAHLHAGHTTMNPYVRRFEGRGSEVGGIGGSWLVPPKTARFRKWRADLRTTFRFDFPFLSVTEIAARYPQG